MVQVLERRGVAAPTRKLRDLTADEFHDIYGCDRFDATIVVNRFRHIVSHICNQLRIRSFSPILRDVADLCGILSGPDSLGYPMVAVSETLPLFYGSVPDGAVTDTSLEQMIRGFHDEYEKRSGTRFEQFPVEGVTYRLQLINPSAKAQYPELERRSSGGPPVAETITLRHLYDKEVPARVYERDTLLAGDGFDGPAIVREETSTTFVPPGRSCNVGDHGELVIA